MEVAEITQSKALYVLPLPSYDAIFGMPFLNGRKIVTYPDRPIISIDNMDLSIVKDPDEPISISVISRSRLKAEIRKNEITELYLAVAKIADMKPSSITSPDWIKSEFPDIFREGLSPGMPPDKK